mmetsp:Transcript_33802/g.100652  ORF Transcript_33802/g.100652 Transcript_33802/m.100652 type:complete len:222 (-) Transcript_33802:1176-1841(-)
MSSDPGADSAPSMMRIAWPSYASQYVILRSVPVVTSWLSSGWYTTALKNVFANRLTLRLNVRMSQMMQLPSELADTNSSLFDLMRIELTVPRWSFIDASSVWLCGPIRHTRTWPSSPPLTILRLSDVHASAVTDLRCASLMVYSSLPLCGPNARILPSLHPLMMDLPSVEKMTQRASRFGTLMRSSSRQLPRCHTRMWPTPHVAKTSLYSVGKHRSLMGLS